MKGTWSPPRSETLRAQPAGRRRYDSPPKRPSVGLHPSWVRGPVALASCPRPMPRLRTSSLILPPQRRAARRRGPRRPRLQAFGIRIHRSRWVARRQLNDPARAGGRPSCAPGEEGGVPAECAAARKEVPGRTDAGRFSAGDAGVRPGGGEGELSAEGRKCALFRKGAAADFFDRGQAVVDGQQAALSEGTRAESAACRADFLRGGAL